MRTAIGPVLTAAMLLSSIVPPGHRHTHPDGGRDHDHSGDHAQAGPAHHDHAHHGPGQGPTAHHARHATAELASEPHVHFVWLLFKVTLPVRDDADIESSGPMFLVRLFNDSMARPAGPSGLEATALSPATVHATPAPATPALRPALRPGGAVFLCDAARHERSGVQLF